MKPTGKLVGTMSRGIEARGVSPLAQGRLDEALGLAVGFGRIGAGSDMFNPELATGLGKGQGGEAGTVVGHDALKAYAEALVEDRRLLEAGHGAGLAPGV